MAELRIFRGWTRRELEARVTDLGALPTSFDEEAYRSESRRWHPEQIESIVGYEPPGPPSRAFARAKAAVAGFAFSDPRIVAAYFDPSRPLLGRRMLLELRVLGLHYLCGTVVGAVLDEERAGASIYGFRYETLEGHIERGFEWFVIEKDHASGAIRFAIASRWRAGDFPNLWSRVGFALLARRYRALWLERAHARMRAIVGDAAHPPPVRARARRETFEPRP